MIRGLRYAIPLSLALWALLFSAAFADDRPFIEFKRNTSESEKKHIATGAAIGAGGMGVCLEATGHRWPLACAVGVMAATSAAYVWKESGDSKKYGNGRTLDGRDIAEGVGGAAGGVVIMYTLAEW